MNCLYIGAYNRGFKEGARNISYTYIPNIRSINTPVKNVKLDFNLFAEVLQTIATKYYDKASLNTEKLMEGAIKGMVNSLDDPFTEFLTVKDAEELNTELSGSFDGIGAEVSKKNGEIIIVAPLKNTPADKAGLMPQDEIVAVDGVSTYNLSVTDVVTKIRGKKNTKVELTIMRNTWDKPKIISIVRSSINIPSAEVTMLPNNIALLRIYNFYQPLPSQIAKAVQTIQTNKAKGIILDLRNNPGGFLDIYTDIGNYFFADNTLLLIEDYEDKQFNKEYKTFRDGELKDIPIVVLINEGTASAAEILAGALRDNRGVKLVGENSFGKGSVQELVDLSGGNQLKITVAHWLTPNGTDISKKGIKPDIVVKLEQEEDNGSYSAITLENDSQLKRAYDEIISSAK